MLKNEKGFIYLPVLLLSSLLFFYLSETLPLFITTHQISADEWGKLQAESNAEAGIWIAIEEIRKNPESYKGNHYLLSIGEVNITLDISSMPILQIHSLGTALPHYQSEMRVTYDQSINKVISWQR